MGGGIESQVHKINYKHFELRSNQATTKCKEEVYPSQGASGQILVSQGKERQEVLGLDNFPPQQGSVVSVTA